MNDINDPAPAREAAGPEPARHSFRKLLATNPNYFGTFPDLAFEAVEPKSLDSAYEELECVSYSPERDRLEATVLVKRSFGYLGGPCTDGSFEHVRFYIDYGGGWEDAGAAAINVHDLPEAEDCNGRSTHPLSYVCGVPHTPRRQWCANPVLPKIRAILSWNFEPPAGQPDWEPTWGNVHDCRAQINPRRFVIADIAHHLPDEILSVVPQIVLEEPPSPNPDPGPLQTMSLDVLATNYRQAQVPVHRFAFPTLQAASAPGADAVALSASAAAAKAADVDLADVLKAVEDTSGNTTFEELECLGLDNGMQSLVATFRVKLSSGYSGPPCSEGSMEHVAFWADWGDECQLEYLGTVPVRVHDYEEIGDGLCYAAILPVDLGALRPPCHKPSLRRVRAVLSWNAAPSTTDPDELPVWGNRIDSHVQIEPGQAYDGTARFTIVGGVAAQKVSLATGLTLSGATLGTSVNPLPDDCPFAGLVVLHGPLDPALAGHQYRIRATNIDSGGSVLLTQPFTAVTSGGMPLVVAPDPVNGWVQWPTWVNNTTGVLGHLAPGGDDRWDFTLELDLAGNVVATARVQMDNTIRNEAELTDTVNAGDLELNTAGACKVPHGPVTGTFVARDRHFLRWSIGVLGGPGGPIPPTPLTVGPPPITQTQQTPFSGTAFSIDFSDPMIAPCGYVVRLTIVDRAIVNSVTIGNHTTTVDRGLCLD
ncbi:MAG TPA: hypothetical protein VHF27_01990 [Acidimicrobiales bacterium]|nr:hypothetical protein [Acidimicrobiales bacterium]